MKGRINIREKFGQKTILTFPFPRQVQIMKYEKISEKQKKIDGLFEFIPELQAAKGRSLTCEKNTTVVEITITPAQNGGAHVMTVEKYDEVQTILSERHQNNSQTLSEKIRDILN